MILVFRETDGVTGNRLTLGEAPIGDGEVLIRSGRYITGSAVGVLHDPVTVVDSASINFTLVGQQLTGEVLMAGITHNLLSATHPDTDPANVVRGDIIVGDKTPLWSRLPIGADGTFLRSDGTDAEWSTIQDTDFVHNLLSLTHHGDTIPQDVARGALIVGIASPEPSTTTTTVSPSNLFWSRLDIGAEGMVLQAGLEDVEWGWIIPENLGVMGTDGTIAKFGATGIEDSIITEVGATITINADMAITTGSITSASGAISFGNENLSTTGTLGCGTITSTGNLIIADAGYIGSTSDTDAIQIEADGDVLFSQKVGIGASPTYMFDARITETASGLTSVAAYCQADVTNNTEANFQGVGLWAAILYRGTQSEGGSNKGSRCLDASAFCYNTGTTEYFGGFRLDARNLSTGTVTHMYGAWIPTILNSGGGTISNLYCFRAQAQTAGVNNFGFHSNLSAAAGRFNFYAAGTALNFFLGDVTTRGHLSIDADNKYLYVGAGQDSGIVYDGTDMLFYANLVGSGVFKFKDATIHLETINSGATQAAAGAAANEVWKTNGHATLPDNVLMIGV